MDVVVESTDFGGLSFHGAASSALEVARILRAAIDQGEPGAIPNYLSDFVFGLEVACQEAGLLDEDFNRASQVDGYVESDRLGMTVCETMMMHNISDEEWDRLSPEYQHHLMRGGQPSWRG